MVPGVSKRIALCPEAAFARPRMGPLRASGDARAFGATSAGCNGAARTEDVEWRWLNLQILAKKLSVDENFDLTKPS